MISKDLNLAKELLNQHKIIGFPTETVYGLAGNAFSIEAINKIFETKQRPNFNPLIVHIQGIEDLEKIAIDIPQMAYDLANAFWPGPLTMILKKQNSISDLITANQDTVAVRVPNHPMALDLLRSLDFPIVAPSANPYMSISPTSPNHVEKYFKNKIELVLDGGICSTGIESTIIGFQNNKVVVHRLGALNVEDIEKISGKLIVQSKNNIKTQTPGKALKHYSPKTDLILTRNVSNEIGFFSDKKIGLLLFNEEEPNFNLNHQFILSKESDLKIAASKLYDALHQLDNMNFDIIIAERFPEFGMGNTINDRLERASKH